MGRRFGLALLAAACATAAGIVAAPASAQRLFTPLQGPVAYERQRTDDLMRQMYRSSLADIEDRYQRRAAERNATVNRFLQMGRDAEEQARAERRAVSSVVVRRQPDAGELFSRLNGQAQAGDRDAARMAATMLFYGMHAAADRAAGLAMYRRAADLGDLESANFYGAALVRGLGGQADVATGLSYLQQAAEKGHPGAMGNLGLAWRQGWQGSPDQAKAFDWFKRAAQAGDAGGLYGMGTMLMLGQDVPKDTASGLRALRQAEHAGHADAAGFLAILAQLGEPVGIAPADAINALRRAADADSALANHHLGTLQIADPALRNVAEGRQRLQRNAADGNMNSVSALCVLYTSGRESGVRDLPYARPFCKQGADAGEPTSTVAYIEHLRGLFGDEPDHPQADRYADQALSKGIRTRIGKRPHSGASAFYVRESVQALFSQAMRDSDPGNPQRNMARALQGFEAAGAQGAEYAANAAWLIHRGDLGLPRNKTAALRWLKQAADLEHPEAMTSQALMLLKGEDAFGDPASKDADRAVELLQKSQQAGHSIGQYLFAVFQLPGSDLQHPRVKKDKEAATRLLRAAAAQGFAPAQELLKEQGLQ